MFKFIASATTVLVIGLIAKYFRTNSERVFTPEELGRFDGTHHPELYLAILGVVYNVTKGEKHYGRGQSYHGFVGRDASRGFVTGEFSQIGASDDVTGLDHKEFLQLKHWIQFYSKNYQKIGKVVGRYYDKDGKQMEYKKTIHDTIKRAEEQKKSERLEEQMYPPCNVEWDVQSGTKVWCTKRSGGIVRNWIGVPRKLFEPGLQSERCACISEENLSSPSLKEYENCENHSTVCYIALQ